MNRETADRICERGILVLILAILIWGPLASGAVRTQDFLVILPLTAGALILWMARLWLNDRPKLLCPPLSWVLLAWVTYAIGRYLTCDIEYVGRLELLRILIYAALFLLIVSNLHGQENTQLISFTMIFLGMALAMCAIWQYLARINKVPSLGAFMESIFFSHKHWLFPRIYADRSSGTYINPNHLAGLLELLLPLALAYTLTGRSQPVMKVLLGYAALVMLAGIAVTGSRGGWVATGLALLTFFALLASHRSYRLPALVMFLVLLGAGSYFVFQSQLFKLRLQPTFANGKVELETRAEIWNASLLMWQDHPWWGVGPGHFDYYFRAYRPPEVQLQPDHVHNDYLELLDDWGLIGAALATVFLVTLAVGVAKTWRFVRRSEHEFKSNRSNKFALVVGVIASLIALGAHSAVDFNLHIPANAILAVALMALLGSHLRFATERFWLSLGGAAKTVVSLALLAAATVFWWQFARLGREYLWLERANGQGNYSPERAHLLEKAYAIEPNNPTNAFAIAECYRTQSFEGGNEFAGREGYEKLAQRAMLWYSRGTNSNPRDGYNFLGLGRCLDYVGRTNESPGFFARAEELDPNGYWTSAYVGRHYVDLGDFAAARIWLERSLRLQSDDNDYARTWMSILNERLWEKANPRPSLPGVKAPADAK